VLAGSNCQGRKREEKGQKGNYSISPNQDDENEIDIGEKMKKEEVLCKIAGLVLLRVGVNSKRNRTANSRHAIEGFTPKGEKPEGEGEGTDRPE